MNTPYDNGKVKIGSNYHPDRRPAIDDDMELIQSVLLGNYRSIRQKNLQVFLYLIALACTIWAAMVFAR